MSRPVNPFDPGRPISPEHFVGRGVEIGELQAALTHAKASKPRHFLLTGERGAGKTSFLDYIRRKATQGSRGDGFNFLVVDFAINRRTTRLDFARTLQVELERLLAAQAPIREALAKTWAFIQKIEAAGFSIKSPATDYENHRDIYASVADSLCLVVSQVCGVVGDELSNSGCDGLLILIDEVDQSSDDLDIGAFLKYLLERLNRNQCHQVVLGLAGLKSSTEVLVRSHPSSLRMFDELPLGNLSVADVDDLFAYAEFQVVTEGVEGFRFSKAAKERIFELSGGHPYFVHQFGYCAFEQACKRWPMPDFAVHEADVLDGAFDQRGGFDVIGDVYFEHPLHSVSESNSALQVLDFMSESPSQEITLERLRESLDLDQHSLAQALLSLCEAGILDGPGPTGKSYRLRHYSFGYWFKARAMA